MSHHNSFCFSLADDKDMSVGEIWKSIWNEFTPGIVGCFKIAPLSNFLTAQQISDGVLAADYEFDIIF